MSLSTPVQFIKGVGPERAELLNRLGVTTAADLLFFFPRDYEDMSEIKTIDQLVEGEAVSVCGVVEEVEIRNTGPGRSILGVLIRQDAGHLRAVWFNQPYMRGKFVRDRRVMLSGTPRLTGLRWEMSHPKVEVLGQGESPPQGQILPVYRLTDGLNQSRMRRMVESVVKDYVSGVEEVLPHEILDACGLCPIRAALDQIHRPASRAQMEQARHRLVYQELLVLQLALALRRWNLGRQSEAAAMPVSAKIDSRIRRLFPFELTDDQNTAIGEISADLGRVVPMNRLLQGEVGSGKTVVAEYAMLLTVAHQCQAVMMAPTEVLARQHFETLGRDLAQSRVRLGLLTGTLSRGERQQVLAAIQSGDIDLVVGTQAVLGPEVQFQRLGLVIIDEQHRFGVRQRANLKQAGADPHYLVMTATPIPRTMAMTVFGDLDVSTLHHDPPGRQPVHTYLGENERREQWWQFFCKKLDEGRQGFVICPLVEESDEAQTAGAEQTAVDLERGPLAGYRVSLVHGRQKPGDKQQAMQAFRRGETQVLVATSVVEVGIDVPNASVMTVLSGERFGLAQLHQLRGRIRRGKHPGYVCIFATPGTHDAHRRLEAITHTTNGFELAEVDFNLRGPGDLLGTRQHGLPPLRIADLIRDADVLIEARRFARELAATHPGLQHPSFQRLRRMVLTRYAEVLELGDVG